MNYPDSGTVSTTAKKIRFSSATLALIVGLALLLPGAAALAINNPIPGVDIIVKKNPSGIPVSAPTGSDGTYQFKGLAAGKYDLSVGGQRVQTITVGANQGISGVLSSEPGGKASITFNGQVGVVPDLPGAPVVTTRSNIKRPSKVDAATGGAIPPLDVNSSAKWTPVIPRPNDTDSIIAAPKAGDRKLPHIKIVEIKGDQSPEEISLVGPTMRVNQPITTKDVDNLTQSSVPARKDRTLPSRVGDPIPVTGLNLPGYPITSITISLPANPDAKVMVTGDVKPGISDQGAAGGLISYATASPQKSGDKELPGIASPGTPIQGIPIGLEGDPGSIKVSAQTDKTGTFHFDKLPAGKYKLKVHGLPDQSFTVGGDGIAGGKLMKGSDGSISIFDRWGSRNKPHFESDPPDVQVNGKTAENPVGFGRGNAGFGGTGPGMVGGGMAPPGAAMGGAVGPGSSPMSGSPGSAMRP